jgi:putative hydrolase of HD superfamily
MAAERIFGLLPDDQAAELHALWMEFEAGVTADARFAVALDRLQPLLLNFQHQGGSWRANAITHDRVLVRMAPIQDGAPELWPFVVRLLAEAVARGYLAPAPAEA